MIKEFSQQKKKLTEIFSIIITFFFFTFICILHIIICFVAHVTVRPSSQFEIVPISFSALLFDNVFLFISR